MKYYILTLILLFIHVITRGQSTGNAIRVSGQADFLKEHDTVTIRLYKYGILNQEPLFQTVINTTAQRHNFHFNLPANNYPQYINITFKGHYERDLYYYLVESGDKFKLNFKNTKLSITGENCANFKVQYQIWRIKSNYNQNHRQPDFNATTLEHHFFILDSIAMEQFEFLKFHRKELSKRMYDYLSTNIIASANLTKYSYLNSYGIQYLDSLANPILQSFYKYQSKSKTLSISQNDFSSYSDYYVHYLIEKYKVDTCLVMKKPLNIVDCLSYFSQKYKGHLKEQLITTILCDSKQFPKELSKWVANSLPFIENPAYRIVLTGILSNRIEGAQAYNFSLRDLDDNIIQLAEYKDQVVLLDFWFTGCASCRQLAPTMLKIEREFKNDGVKFIGISIDKNRGQWLNSIKSGNYVSPDIINLYTLGNGTQNPAIQNYKVHSYPTIVVITKKGQILNVSGDPRYDNGLELRKLITSCLK